MDLSTPLETRAGHETKPHELFLYLYLTAASPVRDSENKGEI